MAILIELLTKRKSNQKSSIHTEKNGRLVHPPVTEKKIPWQRLRVSLLFVSFLLCLVFLIKKSHGIDHILKLYRSMHAYSRAHLSEVHVNKVAKAVVKTKPTAKTSVSNSNEELTNTNDQKDYVRVSTDPDSQDLKYKDVLQYAQRYMASNNYAKAVDILSNYAPPFRRYAYFYGQLAKAYLLSNRSDYALLIYRKLVKLDPANSTWMLGQGLSEEESGEIKEAINSLSTALELGGLKISVQLYIQNKITKLKQLSRGV